MFRFAVLLLALAITGMPSLPAIAQPVGSVDDQDYDADDDGLIEVSSLAQLNAIRWDRDGDGLVNDDSNSDGYDAAFPAALTGMGCPSAGCRGYELTADLDFDSGDWNLDQGWIPIGFGILYQDGNSPEFEAVFDGNGHTISNLYINLTTSFPSGSGYIGLFSITGGDAIIRNVGLESVDVSPRIGSRSGQFAVGGLVGMNRGTISDSYVTGAVRSIGSWWGTGGLVGNNFGDISASYSTASVTSSTVHEGTGGLVGANRGDIDASYATGNVSGGDGVGGLAGTHRTQLNFRGQQEIIASYATGNVSGTEYVGGLVGFASAEIFASYSLGTVSGSEYVGGLVGRCANICPEYDWNRGEPPLTSYWDTQTSGQANSALGLGKTSSDLKQPTGYTGIYANWNVDLDREERSSPIGEPNGILDDPWDFGTGDQYPVLKYGGFRRANQRSGDTTDGDTPQEQPYAALIAQMNEWRNDPQWVSYQAHTDRWDRALLAFGETVADATLTPMTAAEAQGFADQGWSRWVEVAEALQQIESAAGQTPAVRPTVSISAQPYTVAEGSSVQVTATLSAALAADVTIPLTVARRTSEDGDHGTLSGIAIPAGFTSATGTIGTTDDTDTDDETFTVSLGSLPSSVTAGSVWWFTVRITDDDTPPQQQSLGQPVVQNPHAALIVQMNEWRNDPQWVSYQAHTDRWDRALLAFGETVADATLTPMTAAEAQGFADQGWSRWVEVAKALQQIESAEGQTPAVTPTISLSAQPNPVAEGDSVQVTATLSAGLAADVTIPLTVTRGTSENGDHGTLSGIAILAGFTSATGTIATTDDADTDDETFTVSLGSLPSSVTAGSVSSVTVTITDDDTPPQQQSLGLPVEPDTQTGDREPPEDTPSGDGSTGDRETTQDRDSGDDPTENQEATQEAESGGEPAQDETSSPLLEGTDNRDVLQGGPGSDEMYGYGGPDYLFGYGGHDLIYGGPGDDVLNGGEGNDELHGGSGNDRLTGGPGADRFVVSSSDTGDKRILDFDRGAGDRIVLKTEDGAAQWDPVSEIIADVAAESTGTWVYDLGDGLYVVTENAQLRAEDFVTK